MRKQHSHASDKCDVMMSVYLYWHYVWQRVESNKDVQIPGTPSEPRTDFALGNLEACGRRKRRHIKCVSLRLQSGAANSGAFWLETGQYLAKHCVWQAGSFKVQWSLYVPPSGHYMYRTVVIICTAQRSIYVQHSGHYMYRPVVNVCTAQWSLYVPQSGHYMYRTVVTIRTAQWSLCVRPSGH